MVVKVAMADHFQFKVMPSIKNFCLLKQGDVHYIGGTDILPAPLGASEEQNAIEALGTASDAEAKHTLIEHNLRLVVYIAKKFDNTGVGVEDLISIGTIGLIKAINSYDKDKNIKLATYASRCIENEILMYLRRNSKIKAEVSIDEPLNVDWDGNELLLSDIIGTDEDIIYRDIETEVECKMLKKAINQLPARGATPAITGRFDVNYILGQKLVDSRQQTVVVDYYSSTKESELEYTRMDYEQATFDFL